MTKKCDLTGKQSMTGNNVSHANNKTKRKFFPNLQSVSLYSEYLETKLNFKIILTGGLADLYKKSINTKCKVDKDLTIKGIIKIAKNLI